MAAVRVSAKHEVIGAPFNPMLANIIPGVKVHGGEMFIPHTRDTTRLLRNQGLAVPAPIIAQYNWQNTTPFATQRTTAALLTMNDRSYVLSQMGTGKTRATLFAVDYLLQREFTKKVLVVAPLSTLAYVWDAEIFRYFPHLTTRILHGTAAQRVKALNEDADIYIINHDGVETILPHLQKKQGLDMVVVDELSVVRNARTDRWKALNALINGKGSGIQLACGLTGSPTPNAPTDAWGQCRLLTPHTVPKYFKQFREQTMMQVSTFRWVPRREANEIVYEAMQPAVRYLRSDCMELPDVLYQTCKIQASAKITEVYDELLKKLKAGFAEGVVTAANEGVLLNKLLQVSSGYVYTSDKNVVELDNTARMQFILDTINGASGKVIVFAEFTHTVDGITRVLQRKKIKVESVTGATPAKARAVLFRRFQETAEPKVLVAHPMCMSHGLTLTAADTIIWATPTTRLETYEQACARITRPGQRTNAYIMQLVATPIEARVFSRLEQKASMQGALLELFE